MENNVYVIILLLVHILQRFDLKIHFKSIEQNYLLKMKIERYF